VKHFIDRMLAEIVEKISDVLDRPVEEDLALFWTRF
jgi:hypothetical protein